MQQEVQFSKVEKRLQTFIELRTLGAADDQ